MHESSAANLQRVQFEQRMAKERNNVEDWSQPRLVQLLEKESLCTEG